MNHKAVFVRLTLSVLLLALMWLDYKWALYLTVTLLAIASELTELNFDRISRRWP